MTERHFADWRQRAQRELAWRRLLVTALPAIVTYSIAVVTLRSQEGLIETEGGPASGFGAILMLVVFTLGHGVFIVTALGFAYSQEEGRIGFMAWVMLALLYGIPTLAFAWEADFWPLAGLGLHVFLAKRGTRIWVVLEYGLCSFFLLLFLASFDRIALFPWGIPGVVFQGFVLYLMAIFARPLWVRES